nr:hypothetical protein Iba_chr14dCG4760 [Ipomoea batatas]
MFSNVFFIIPPPVRVLPISAITSANSTTVSAIFFKTEVTFLKDSSDNSSRTFSAICSGFREDKSSRKCFVDIRVGSFALSHSFTTLLCNRLCRHCCLGINGI